MKLEDLAARIGAKLKGPSGSTADAEVASVEVTRVSNLRTATSDAVSFLSDRVYRDALKETRAAAVIVAPRFAALCPVAALVMENPYLGFALAAQIFDTTPPVAQGISPHAFVDPTAKLGADVALGAGAVVGAYVVLGDRVQLGSGVTLGEGVSIGAGTRLYPGCHVYHGCRIGCDCLVQAGAVIGSDGFGYAPDAGRWRKIPQLGHVIIGDRVEIGANTCIDRGAVDDTVIENDVIIDNLCQIAHNVRIGAGTAMAGHTTVAGSVTIGRHCIIGGFSVLNGHISICDGTVISGDSAVMRSTKNPGVYSSALPAMPHKVWRYNMASFIQLDKMRRRLRALESRLGIATSGEALQDEPAEDNEE